VLGFAMLCGGLLVLYITKYWFPLNFAALVAFSLLQAILCIGFDAVFGTYTATLIVANTFFQMVVMFFASRFNQLIIGDEYNTNPPSEWYFEPSQLTGFYLPALLACILTLVLDIAVAAAGVFDMSFGGFLFVTGVSCTVMVWFAYDASCMVRKVSTDE
jgi:hypothetical protein